jgi:hypothetical protein
MIFDLRAFGAISYSGTLNAKQSAPHMTPVDISIVNDYFSQIFQLPILISLETSRTEIISSWH